MRWIRRVVAVVNVVVVVVVGGGSRRLHGRDVFVVRSLGTEATLQFLLAIQAREFAIEAGEGGEDDGRVGGEGGGGRIEEMAFEGVCGKKCLPQVNEITAVVK
jgi:hypothetical protein